jgi:uncharacterized protein YeaO (DUF488 family)
MFGRFQEKFALSIQIRRAYDPPQRGDGYRVLVDRVWPRGRSKNDLKLDEWRKEIAPSTRLRQWFGHDPARWKEFQQRYFTELEQKQDSIPDLVKRARHGRITLVYGARDRDQNQAVALRAYLRARVAGRQPRVR